MKPVCIYCGHALKPRGWIPFAWCSSCKAAVQVVWQKEDVERPYYDTFIINFSVDVPSPMCEVLTSTNDSGKCRTYRFPVTKRYDRAALTELLYAASMQYNSDYISEDYVYNLVSNALDSIWYGMRKYGIRKLRPKKGAAVA